MKLLLLFPCLFFPVWTTDCPQECSCSGKSVDCRSRSLTDIPCNKIAIDTEKLDLSNNMFTVIPDQCFRNLSQLSQLYLQNCHLKRLNNSTFDGLDQLKRLYLNNCKFSPNYLSSNVLQPLAKLEYINLGSTRLDEIPDIFIPDTLNHLNLAGNNINEIAFTSNYSQLSGLVIDLSQNNIKSIDKNSLKALKSVNTLKLKNNKLVSADMRSFDSVRSSLASLDVSENPSLGYAGVQSILLALKSVNNIHHINLDRTALSTINSTLFSSLGKSKLIILSVRKNNIVSLGAGSFSDLEYLQELYMTECGLTHLQANQFTGLKKLNQLYLSNNQIEIIEKKAFDGLDKLKIMDLSFNRLPRVLNCSVFNLISLNYLNLSHNSLKYIKDCTFVGLTSLERLDLRFNKISVWDNYTFQSMRNSLQELQLSNNNVSSIYDAGSLAHNQLNNSLAELNFLKYLDVSTNPFNCSCDHIGWFVNWMKTNKRVNILNKQISLCSSPSVLKNKQISSLNCSDIQPVTLSPAVEHHSQKGVVIAALILIPLLLAGSILVFLYWNQRPRFFQRSSQEGLLENEEFSNEQAQNLLPEVIVRGNAITDPTMPNNSSNITIDQYDDVPPNFDLNSGRPPVNPTATANSCSYDLYMLCSPDTDASQWDITEVIAKLNEGSNQLRIFPHSEQLPPLRNQLSEIQSAKRLMILFSDDLAQFLTEDDSFRSLCDSHDPVILLNKEPGQSGTTFIANVSGDDSVRYSAKKVFYWSKIQTERSKFLKLINEILNKN